ncbi:MAG: STAS domain-containing protein [Chitinivibrionales bacterium]|nr:STAS domain-containing protein [Chitinivibrionales bacterium]
MELTCTIVRKDKWVIIALRGELAFDTITVLKNVINDLLKTKETSIALDLTEVRLISSLGLSTLLQINQEVTAKSGILACIRPSDNIADVLYITGCYKIIPLYASEPDLLQNHPLFKQ